MKIKELIEKRIEMRNNLAVKPNPVFAKTHNLLLHTIDSYWNSQFAKNPYDAKGFRKPFLNVVRVPTFVSAKATDLDTKNIRIYANEGHDFHKAYIFNKELDFYFREIGFDKLLNEITYNRPKYGHIVLKKVKEKIHIVPISSLYTNVNAKTLGKNVIERHEYSFDELDEYEGWENKQKVKDLYQENGREMAICWEISGKVDDDSYDWRIVAGAEYGMPIYLASGNVGNMYKELKWEDVPNRHLGRGTVEEQFESQIAVNENEYLFRLGLQWTSKQLFQSKDVQTARNLLTEAYNGDVLPANQPIEKIAMEERNLGAFNYSDGKWLRQSQSLSFSQDVIRGDRPPAGTTATQSVLQAQQLGGYYDLKREDAGIFLKEVIEDWILPDFKKKNRKSHTVHIMRLLGADTGAEQFFNAILNSEVNKKVIDFMSRGKILNSQELMLLKGLTADSLRHKDIEIPDDFYDFEYSVKVVVTGEQIDMAQRAVALQTAFQVIGSNPTVLQDPTVRKLYFKLLDASGLNPVEIFDEEQPSALQAIQNTIPQGQQAQRGGSIAAPRQAPTANPGTTQVAQQV